MFREMKNKKGNNKTNGAAGIFPFWDYDVANLITNQETGGKVAAADSPAAFPLQMNAKLCLYSATVKKFQLQHLH